MKRIALAIAIILWFPIYGLCGPYLVCDPQATVTHYKITGDAYWTANVPAQADGAIRSDLQGISTGNHNIQVVACRTSDGWPEVCSTPAPFSFTRPVAPNAPSDLAIVP